MRHAALYALIAAPLMLRAAQENFGAGTQAAAWLKLPNSARSAAMGEAVGALEGDVNSVNVNPAGLAGLSGHQVSFFHNIYIQDTAVEHAAYGLSLGEGRGAGFSVDFINFGKIDKYKFDPSQNLLVPDGSFTPTGLDLNAAYAHSFGPVSAGLNVKMISQSLDGSSSVSTFGADLGALWRQTEGGLSLGLAVQNVGAQLDGANLPLNFKGGLAWRMAVGGEGGLLFAADVNSPSADIGASAFGLGAEFTGSSFYALRGGYKITGNGGVSGFSAGAGLTYSIATLDYAFVSQGVLGNSNQFSLTVKF